MRLNTQFVEEVLEKLSLHALYGFLTLRDHNMFPIMRCIIHLIHIIIFAFQTYFCFLSNTVSFCQSYFTKLNMSLVSVMQIRNNVTNIKYDCNENDCTSETSSIPNDSKILSKLKCSVSLCSTDDSWCSYDLQSSENSFDEQVEYLNERTSIISKIDDALFDISHLLLSESEQSSNPISVNDDDDDDEDIDYIQRQASKCLRFDVDANDRIIEYHYKYQMCDSMDAYTSANEEVENRQLLMKQCRRFHRLQPELVGRLNRAYASDNYTTDQTVFDEWSASFLRGFESNLIQEPTFHIRSYVDFVILYYHSLQEVSIRGGVEEEYDIDEMLRNRILKKSERSRNFSKALAAADEIEANKYW